MLLGVDAAEFANKMVTQTTITGRGSILEIKLTPEQAKNAMDAFCKYLYGELFHHVISRINACAKQQTSVDHKTPKARVQGGSNTPSLTPFIGILDIFGFEVMKRNSLEQLCINFTNETLQQQFNKHVFVLEQERYAREGIAVSPVEFQDNQRCLDLIQKPPMGLLPLLEEQMLLKRKTTDKQLLTIYHGNHLDKHPSYAKPRFECDEFIIRHYAGDVTYDIHDFIAKNTDNLHDDLLDLLRRSSQPLLQDMCSAPAAASLGGAATKRGGPSTPRGATHQRTQSASLTGTTTVSSRFRTQLAELMEVLWSTTPSYIKCIKPNNLKFPGGFSCELVRDQLVYSGVLEVVRIRQEGFPIRKQFSVFYELFWPLAIKSYGVVTTRGNTSKIRQACEVIAREWLKDKDLERQQLFQEENDSPEMEKDETETTTRVARQIFAMGRNEVFLRYGQIERLEGSLATLRLESIVTLQSKLVRARLAFKTYHLLRQATVKWQALWRMHTQHSKYLQQCKAALKIQARFRAFQLSTLFHKKKRAASVMTRVCRKYITRCKFLRFLKSTRAATEIQRHIRGFYFVQPLNKAAIVLAAFVRQVLQRRRFKKLKASIVKTQAMPRAFGYNSLFHEAAACGDFHVVKYMLSERSADELLSLKNGRGLTAFHEACAYGQHAMVKYLALQMIDAISTMRAFPPTFKDDTTDAPEQSTADPCDESDNQQSSEIEPTTSTRTVVYSGFLRKRRETSRWMRRYVVLSVTSDKHDRPQLDYYPNDRKATLAGPSSLQIDLTTALLKTSVDLPFAFELHSPQLLGGRNKEGRLYFAASGALEIQCWLAHLRNIIPSSIESRVFAMHRSAQGNHLEFIDFKARQQVCNLQSASPRLETPLHLVASCSSLVILAAIEDETPENNKSNNSEINFDVSVITANASAKSKSLLDAELELVKTTQWLIENGADINVMTTRQETPLQLALQAGHLILAKLLLDRGALASSLSEPHLMLVRCLKAELAKHAITSISSSARGSVSIAHPNLPPPGPMNGLIAARNCFLKRPMRGLSTGDDEPRMLFLIKQPGKVLNSSYVSLFVELIRLNNATSIGDRRPRIVISVMDGQRNLVEMRQQVSVQPVAASNALLWGFTWHMQTPLENLPHGACIVVELATTSTSSGSPTRDGALSPTLGASVLNPECWTYLQVDQRTANSAPTTAEMYKYPVDLSSQNTLHRADAFLSGEMLISQAHT
ncbi:hypothetical protein PInf_009030 [Phytophthora infestans]|nr:hypothetical protein PInf_009030 [Phytophthora infestans]